MSEQEEILKELKMIRFMLEDIWTDSPTPKKEKYTLEIIETRLEDEMEGPYTSKGGIKWKGNGKVNQLHQNRKISI